MINFGVKRKQRPKGAIRTQHNSDSDADVQPSIQPRSRQQKPKFGLSASTKKTKSKFNLVSNYADDDENSSDGDFDNSRFQQQKAEKALRRKKQQKKARKLATHDSDLLRHQTITTAVPSYSKKDLEDLRKGTHFRSNVPEVETENDGVEVVETVIPDQAAIQMAKLKRRNVDNYVSLTKPIAHTVDLEDMTRPDDEIMVIGDEAGPDHGLNPTEPPKTDPDAQVIVSEDSSASDDIFEVKSSEDDITEIKPAKIAKLLSVRQILEKVVASREENVKRVDDTEKEIYRIQTLKAKSDPNQTSTENLDYQFTQNLLHFAEDLLDMVESKKKQVDQLMTAYVEHLAKSTLKHKEHRRTLAEQESQGKLDDAVRAKRVDKVFMRQIGKITTPDGYSSEESSDDEELLFDPVFEDVDPELATTENVLKWFRMWQSKKAESFVQCYAADCIGKVLPVFINYSLIQGLHSPLKPDFTDRIEKTAWFKSVLSHSLTGERIADKNVLNTTLTRSLIPYLTSFIKNVWDPTSLASTGNLVRSVVYFTFLPNFSKRTPQINELFDAIQAQIEEVIQHEAFIPIDARANVQFHERQCWKCIKLVEAVFLWRGVLSDELIEVLAVQQILNRYVKIGINGLTTESTKHKMLMRLHSVFKDNPAASRINSATFQPYTTNWQDRGQVQKFFKAFVNN